MKRHLLRGVTATLVSVVVSLPVGARPAAAAEDSILDYVKTGIEIVKLLFGGGMSVEEAVQRIEARIQAAETAIIANNQRLAAAQARACATGAVTNFVNFPGYNPDNKQAFAIEVTNCAALIESLRGVTTDKAALDTLGFASQVITPIALTAQGKGPIPAILVALLTIVAGIGNSLLPHKYQDRDEHDPHDEKRRPEGGRHQRPALSQQRAQVHARAHPEQGGTQRRHLQLSYLYGTPA